MIWCLEIDRCNDDVRNFVLVVENLYSLSEAVHIVDLDL